MKISTPCAINPSPETISKALADCGELGTMMTVGGGDGGIVPEQFAGAGGNMDVQAVRLQDKGAKLFVEPWNELMSVIASRNGALRQNA